MDMAKRHERGKKNEKERDSELEGVGKKCPFYFALFNLLKNMFLQFLHGPLLNE